MTTKVEKSVVVDAPLSTVYNQWTQFEQFPEFMGAVEQVTQLGDDRLEWVAELAGVRRQWVAKILEQVPDTKVAWAAVEGATNAGAVTFSALGPDQTEVHLSMEYEPEGFVETIGEWFKIVETQAEDDLENFKRFIENQGRETGAWRGAINEGATVQTPGVEDAASSWGDSGKVGDPAEQEAGFRDEDVAAASATDPITPDLTTPRQPPRPADRRITPAEAGTGIGDEHLLSEPGATRPDGDDQR